MTQWVNQSIILVSSIILNPKQVSGNMPPHTSPDFADTGIMIYAVNDVFTSEVIGHNG